MVLLSKHFFLLHFLLCAFCAYSQQGGNVLIKKTFWMEKMASPFDIVIYAYDTTGLTGTVNRISRELDDIIFEINHYEENSDVNLFCEKQVSGKKITISPDLTTLLRLSKKAYKLSNGKFDVSVGCLIHFWKSKKNWDSMPADSILRTFLPRKNISNIRICGRKAKWGVENACLDFGGLGKGYVAQKFVDELEASGYPIALINAGGDIVTGESKGNEPWKVGVELKDGSLESQILNISNYAVATSGDMYQYITIGDERFSHIIDPETMKPVKHRTNVTVLAPEGWKADFYASYFSILPPSKAVEKANSIKGVEVLISFVEGERINTTWSDGFMKFMKK